MSAQDLEQRAREFHETYERLAPQFGYRTRPETREFDPESANGRLMIAVMAALRQQPAPVDLEQFREAVECWRDAALPANSVDAERVAEAERLLSIIDNAGKVPERLIYTEDKGSFYTVRAWNGVAIGTFYREIDGYWVWQPNNDRKGYIPQEMLAALAIRLQELNKEWHAEVTSTLEKLHDQR